MKKIGVLLLIFFVFCGAWWDKKPKSEAPTSKPPVAAAQPSGSAMPLNPAASPQEPKKVQPPAPAAVPARIPAVKPVAAPPVTQPVNTSSVGRTTKILSTGDAEERKVRMKSLVSLSNALRKQKEEKEKTQ